MFRIHKTLACAALLGAAVCLPAFADSSASLASDSASDSVGSISGSIQHSSNSSSGEHGVAQGDYRIVRMAAADGDRQRLTLQAVADGGRGGEFELVLPAQTVAREHLAAGQTVSAHDRPYGLAFTRADAKEPFFLVLEDGWYRELRTTAVTL